VEFEWDEGNESELARHHISWFEVEPVFARNKGGRAGDTAMYGRTDAGRPLTIILQIKSPTLVRAITGWNMDTGERSRYLRR
jgi:uncharacterized DUF497 family protein